MSGFTQPSREQMAAFRDGDPIAIDEVISLVLPQVTRWACRDYADIPAQETASVVNQVFAEIALNHSRYDPERALITTYAINLIKLRMVDKRQREYELRNFEGIALENHENSIVGTYNDLEHKIDVDRLFATAHAQSNPLEQEFLVLMREGENRIEKFREIVQRHTGMDNLDREVNTIKERIRRRLKSVARELGLDQGDV